MMWAFIIFALVLAAVALIGIVLYAIDEIKDRKTKKKIDNTVITKLDSAKIYGRLTDAQIDTWREIIKATKNN